jgi:anthranilate phosphoribosyltransferase
LEISSAADLIGGEPAENAAIIQAILGGEKGAPRDIVLINAAAAIVAGDQAKSLSEGVQKAAEAIDSGAAKQKLDALVERTNA